MCKSRGVLLLRRFLAFVANRHSSDLLAVYFARSSCLCTMAKIPFRVQLRRRASLPLTREDRNERKPVKPSEIAFAGLLIAVGRGTIEVEVASVGSVPIVGTTVLRL